MPYSTERKFGEVWTRGPSAWLVVGPDRSRGLAGAYWCLYLGTELGVHPDGLWADRLREGRSLLDSMALFPGNTSGLGIDPEWRRVE